MKYIGREKGDILGKMEERERGEISGREGEGKGYIEGGCVCVCV